MQRMSNELEKEQQKMMQIEYTDIEQNGTLSKRAFEPIEFNLR